MIKVTAAHDRRRAGRFFPKGHPVTLDPNDLSEADQLAILSDHVLNVMPVEPEDEPTEELLEKPELSAEERAAKVLAVIPELGDGEKNKDGSPKVKAVSERVGFDVTKAEIEEARAAFGLANDGEGGDADASTAGEGDQPDAGTA